MTPVTTSITQASMSATRVMPKGAGQLPACAATGPSRSTWTSIATVAASNATAPATEIARCSRTDLQARIQATAVPKGMTRGQKSSTGALFLDRLGDAHLVHADGAQHEIRAICQ